MCTVDISVAPLHLTRLFELVATGEEIVIATAGKPVARLVPLERHREPRQPGLLQGKIWIAGDYDDALPQEVMAAFWGERP